jgi:hypothetical protein
LQAAFVVHGDRRLLGQRRLQGFSAGTAKALTKIAVDT